MKLTLYISMVLMLVATCVPVSAAVPSATSVGEAIYRDGILPNGKPVVGTRVDLPSVGGTDTGAAVACVRCHRRSGLGSSEGLTSIPPITSRYLARAREESRLSTDSQVPPGYHVGRPAFTDKTLARAIREGIVPGEGHLDVLMPRYQIDDKAMASLIAYLKTLSDDAAPGVTADTLHFATIVTPDADPTARQGMLDVLRHYFSAPYPSFGAPRKMYHPNRMVGYRSGGHKWVLHVWQLNGKPDTWESQLHKHLSAEPVFAILSGLGGREWAPVHRFCEAEKIPCLLPNVDLPVVAENDFYPIYFSKGVLLEAELGAHWLATARRNQALKRVVQVYRSDDIGAAAASEMNSRLSAAGITVVNHALAPNAERGEWQRAVNDADSNDGLVLWARGRDLGGLSGTQPKARAVLVSGLMAGLTSAPLPTAWRNQVYMTYPLDLPERSAKRTAMPHAWLINNKVPIVDERIQIDTYTACVAMSDVVGSLFDAYSRELVIERFEDMLSNNINPARYPRLGLAQGQRFASKGGYIVRFTGPDGDQPTAEGDWTVP